ncbi:hypothetical protein ACFWNW_01240 [Streptomyces seoulensis]|uniref:hypothetical protein n=1 Tax=Streptomyces seoulensis TaxID=73044 RepID=UPI003649E025
MSFEEEWAQLKTSALARRSSSTRIDHVPADGGGGAGPDASLAADAGSINGNSNLLIEMAGLLQEGRPDAELTTMARVPRAPDDVAKQVALFARFADDQYLDTVALLAALSTCLRSAGTDFVQIEDDTVRRFLENVLQSGEYVAPEAR